MGLPQEAIERRITDGKITEDFLHRHNLQVTRHFENAPTLVWTIEPIEDYPSYLKWPGPPIVLTSLVDKERDVVSIRVNRSFDKFPRQQQILSVFFMGQLSSEQGSLDSIDLASRLQPQTLHIIIDVLQYSRESNFSQLIEDLSDANGWRYVRFPQG